MHNNFIHSLIITSILLSSAISLESNSYCLAPPGSAESSLHIIEPLSSKEDDKISFKSSSAVIYFADIESRISQILDDFFKKKSVYKGNIAQWDTDEFKKFKTQFIEQIEHDTNKSFIYLVRHFLTLEQLALFEFVTFTDLRIILQRLHTLSITLRPFARLTALLERIKLRDLIATCHVSFFEKFNLLYYRGLIWEPWDKIPPHPSVLRALQNRNIEQALKNLLEFKKDILSKIKAFTEYYGIDVSIMQHNYLYNLVLSFEKRSLSYVEKANNESRYKLSNGILKHLYNDMFVLVTVASKLYEQGILLMPKSFIARGYDGMVFKATYKSEEVIIKINVPSGEITSKELLDNLTRLKHIIKTADHPNFVHNVALLPIYLSDNQMIVVEINQLINGRNLSHTFTHPKKNGIGFEQMQGMLTILLKKQEFLASHGFVNLDIENLVNILVEGDENLVTIDLGNIIKLTPDNEKKAKRKLIMAIIRLLSGTSMITVQSDLIGQDMQGFLSDFFNNRFPVKNQTFHAQLCGIIAFGWNNDDMGILEFIEKLLSLVDFQAAPIDTPANIQDLHHAQ